MRRIPLAIAVCGAVLVAACSSDEGPTDTPPSPLESPTAPDTPAAGSPDPGSSTPSPSGTVAPSVDDVRLALQPVADGLTSPVFVTPLSGTADLLVLEQPGRVQRVSPDGEATTWLDLRDRVGSGGNEQGLLGLALHPDFPGTPRVFVHYTDGEGGTTLDEFAATPEAADPSSRRNLLSRPQPASNHNGGMVQFGPDGLLYLALGDGGASGDRFDNAQDPSTLLGAILRLDVDGGDPYAIPPGNPFADGDDGAPEVFVYGLRNPWRFTFDGQLLLIGDVGQNAFEELSVVALEDAPGTNFGWPITEGEACFDPPEGCDREGLHLPVVTYETGPGGTCAVIQGYAYRGARLPALDGHVFYSDFCAGFLRSYRLTEGSLTATDQRDWTGQIGAVEGVTSLGLDHDGELLLTVRDGRILRIVPAA